MKSILNVIKSAAMISLLMLSTGLKAETKVWENNKDTDSSVASVSLPDKTESPIGIEEDDYNKLLQIMKVYPVPASSFINIELDDACMQSKAFKSLKTDDKIDINIYNLTGQKVLSDQFTKSSPFKILDLKSLPDGPYFLSIRMKMTVINKKIVVKNH